MVKDYNWKEVQLVYEENQVGLYRYSIWFIHDVSSCLAHVINLATQALISTYSKAPHFDPKNPEAHVLTGCDEVGLVRAIMVKVHINHLHGSIDAYCYSGVVIIEKKRKVENSSV